MICLNCGEDTLVDGVCMSDRCYFDASDFEGYIVEYYGHHGGPRGTKAYSTVDDLIQGIAKQMAGQDWRILSSGQIARIPHDMFLFGRISFIEHLVVRVAEAQRNVASAKKKLEAAEVELKSLMLQQADRKAQSRP